MSDAFNVISSQLTLPKPVYTPSRSATTARSAIQRLLVLGSERASRHIMPTHTHVNDQVPSMDSSPWTYHATNPIPNRFSRRAPASPPLRRAMAMRPTRNSPRPIDSATPVPFIRHQVARPRSDRLAPRWRTMSPTLPCLVAWYMAINVASPRLIIDAMANAAASIISVASVTLCEPLNGFFHQWLYRRSGSS